MGIGKFAAVAIVLVATDAFADGAFPDEQSIFFFDTAPAQIVVGTNFGLMISEDDGQSWLTACEASISPNLVNFFHAGPDGDGWIYAATSNDLLASSDVACGWAKSSGTFVGQIGDVFADQSKAGRVYVVSSTASASTVQRSEDFASTFAPFFSEMNGSITGIEPARSMPTTVYVAGSHAGVPYVAQSVDDGKNFATFMHPEIKAILRIAAVDPVDPATIYFRAAAGMNDALYISIDGGKTLADTLDLGDVMSAFLRASNGTLYVGSRNGFLWTRPANAAFTKAAAPHLRCLGEHAGAIFGCGDNTLDGFAIGRSADGGKSWAPVVGLQKTGPYLQCPRVQILCASKVIDGGAPDAAVVPDAATMPADGGSQPPPVSDRGCSCNAGGDGDNGAPSLFLLIVAFVLQFAACRQNSSWRAFFSRAARPKR